LVIDTSAVLALMQDEEPAEALRAALSNAAVRLISVASVLEATCVLGSRRGPAAVLDLGLFLSGLHFKQVAFDAEQLSIAQSAWLSYGRGRHAAKLNFGDCISYALAQTEGEPLLFVGADFSRTDIPAARY
jgi:ribonuclease VapC